MVEVLPSSIMPDDHTDATIHHTVKRLMDMASARNLQQLSRLTLPELEAVADMVAQRVPAGNVPAMILDGLAQLSTRKTPAERVRSDVNTLFQGVESMLDKAVFATFFAGPAAVLWAYQQLLRMTGRTPDEAFPDGIWQFYVDYALREDTARHASETHGFDTFLQQQHIRLNPIDRMTVWVMTAIQTLHQYDALLKNEWRERVFLYLLAEITKQEPNAQYYAELYRQWEKKRPYHKPADYAGSYPEYRLEEFNDYLEMVTRKLPTDLASLWRDQIRTAQAVLLPQYQRQMSIRAYLEPGLYSETRVPVPLEKLHIGLIYKEHYYLIPACQAQTRLPAELQTVRSQLAAILNKPSEKPPVHLATLVRVKRSEMPSLRSKLSPENLRELDTLKLAPIIINANARSRQLPLAELRQTERGIGDHAITIFDTGRSFVFDQSHIFFDGAWGASLAEIMTREAISWVKTVYQQPIPVPAEKRPYRPRIILSREEQEMVAALPRVTPEAAAETDAVNLEGIQRLRKLLKQRNDLINLTVNDILILYRAIHAVQYQPSPALLDQLKPVSQHPAVQQALTAITTGKPTDPAMLIPVDASLRSPRDRVYPMSFIVPLTDLELLKLHHGTLEALAAAQHADANQAKNYKHFNAMQRRYLATLAGYGAIISRVKSIASANEGVSTTAAKLLAHVPMSIQQLLHAIPDNFDILNDIIRGREVFSNIGAVVGDSSLTRFITAKDDNEKKTLVWGVITDAGKTMRISLRDFRPHVAALADTGKHTVAPLITQDYLDAYAGGINEYVRQLQEIVEVRQK